MNEDKSGVKVNELSDEDVCRLNLITRNLQVC